MLKSNSYFIPKTTKLQTTVETIINVISTIT